jgi:hypothetical protein
MLLYIDNNYCVGLSSDLDGFFIIIIFINNSKANTITIINNIRY